MPAIKNKTKLKLKLNYPPKDLRGPSCLLLTCLRSQFRNHFLKKFFPTNPVWYKFSFYLL